ncbi:ABC transporter substrate-binding protein [Citricoccus sp. K5]|uniref:ABC transporter substrate-binding protein n=1 Tax=Citricoccus sp. K5 TaxID=2653135 RepID=UPI0012F2393F|nr:ABC transporter substrate-binding protein [Citricoccus sp. K5]VXB35702.1 Peptide/nickel transport system substrate-binding protein [Citricoccus sp. K5]
MMTSSYSTTPGLIRRLRTPLTLAAASSVLLGGCGVANSEPDTAAESPDTLRIALAIEPTTLEPCDSTLSSTGMLVRSNVTEPLVERNPSTGDLEPLLATSWEAIDDLEWTFTLRDDVTFHDGTPFNAQAAAAAIDRAVNGQLGCDVEGQIFGDADVVVEAIDDTTLKVSTEQPDPVLPLRLSFIEIGAPTEGSVDAKVREPVGTGPYSIGSWDSGIKISLDRNDSYWGEASAYPAVDYLWRSEGTVRAAMVAGDEADIATGLSSADGAGDLAEAYPNNETVALRFSGDIAPLNDIRIRQAINYAIDRDGITDSLYAGESEPAEQLVPPGVVGFNESLEPWESDVEMAKELVAAAQADGVDTSAKITIVARNGQFPKISQLTEVLQDQLAQVGLNVESKVVETSVGLQYQVEPFIKDEGAIAMLVQHGNQAGDASFSVDSYMVSDGSMSMFGTPEFDAILEEAAAKTGDDRQQAYADAFKYERENLVQFAYVARMTGLMSKSPTVDYTPNSSTNDELRLSEIRPAQ